MLKFKVGDYVKIKEGAKVGRVPEGKYYKILKVEPGGYYRIEADRPNSVWTEKVLEFATPKDILEPGMIFECRNGHKYMFITENYAISRIGYIHNVFNEIGSNGKDWDIVKIYKKKESGSLGYNLENTEDVIWEEKTPIKEMTVKEISEKLGYEVKVIKG